MAHINADRVRDTTTTTGTGVMTVSGSPPTGFRTLSAVCAVSDTFWYVIAHQTLAEWEVGLGTYSAANQFSRSVIYSSSNAGAAVSFSSGTKDIFIGQPAAAAEGGIVALTDAASVSWNTLRGATASLTLTGTGRTLTMTNMVVGRTYNLLVRQDGTGGRTITTWTNFAWVGNVTPTLTATANATDLVTGVWNGSKLLASMQKGFVA